MRQAHAAEIDALRVELAAAQGKAAAQEAERLTKAQAERDNAQVEAVKEQNAKLMQAVQTAKNDPEKPASKTKKD